MAGSNKRNQRSKSEVTSQEQTVHKDGTVAERLSAVVARVESQFDEGEIKATLTDYIRLLQMQREYEDDRQKSVEVLWIDPVESAE